MRRSIACLSVTIHINMCIASLLLIATRFGSLKVIIRQYISNNILNYWIAYKYECIIVYNIMSSSI
jgi:hypothetical protein